MRYTASVHTVDNFKQRAFLFPSDMGAFVSENGLVAIYRVNNKGALLDRRRK